MNIAFWTVIALIVIGMIALAIVARRRMDGGRTRTTPGPDAPAPSWSIVEILVGFRNDYLVAGNAIPVTMAVLLIDIFLKWKYPTVAWEPMMAQFTFVLFLHLCVIFIALVTVSTGRWKGRTIFILQGLILVSVLGVLQITDRFSDQALFNWIHGPDLSKLEPEQAVKEFPKVVASNAQAKRVFDLVMTSELYKQDSATAKALIIHAGRESNYKQFEPDGTTPLIGYYPFKPGETKKPNGAIGLYQFKPEFWAAKAKTATEKTGKDHRLESLDGQINMAIWVFLNEKNPESYWQGFDDSRRIVARMEREPGGFEKLFSVDTKTDNVHNDTQQPGNQSAPPATPPLVNNEPVKNCDPMAPMTLSLTDNTSKTITAGPKASLASTTDLQFSIQDMSTGVLHRTNMGKASYYAIPQGITEFRIIITGKGDDDAESGMFIVKPCN